MTLYDDYNGFCYEITTTLPSTIRYLVPSFSKVVPELQPACSNYINYGSINYNNKDPPSMADALVFLMKDKGLECITKLI